MNPTWPNYAGKSALIHASEEDGTSKAPGIQAAIAAIEAAHGSGRGATTTRARTTRSSTTTAPRSTTPTASELAWDRTVTFLHEHLG